MVKMKKKKNGNFPYIVSGNSEKVKKWPKNSQNPKGTTFTFWPFLGIKIAFLKNEKNIKLKIPLG